MIGIDHDGDLDIRRGLIRPEDKAAAKKAGKAKKSATGPGDKPETPPAFPAALIENLTAHRTADLQAMLADNPKVALVAVVHALALDCLYDPFPGSCVRIAAKMTYLGGSAEGIDDSPAYKQFAATTKTATKGMPKQPEKLWAWLLDQDQKTLLSILAVCAAETVDSVEKRHGAADRAADAGQPPCWRSPQTRHDRILAAECRGVFRDRCRRRSSSTPCARASAPMPPTRSPRSRRTRWRNAPRPCSRARAGSRRSCARPPSADHRLRFHPGAGFARGGLFRGGMAGSGNRAGTCRRGCSVSRPAKQVLTGRRVSAAGAVAPRFDISIAQGLRPSARIKRLPPKKTDAVSREGRARRPRCFFGS